MSNKDILVLAQALANTRNTNLESTIEALEQALAVAVRKHYVSLLNGEIEVRVSINRDTGQILTFRRYYVFDANEPEPEDPEQELRSALTHLTLEEALSIDVAAKIGDTIEEPIEGIQTTGRKGAATVKSVIQQAMRIAERKKQYMDYIDKVGLLFSAVVKKVTRDFTVFDIGEGTEAVMPRAEAIPSEIFRVGDRTRVYLYAVQQEPRGSQLFVTRASVEMLKELFRLEVPEISEQVIELKAAARDPGLRSKIAVKTNDGRIDPVGACVGMRGARVQAISRELLEERIDIILWHEDPAVFVMNAMAPAQIEAIFVDEPNHTIDLTVTAENLSLAIGKNGQNIRLASELTGWKLNIMSEEEAEKKARDAETSTVQLFAEQLDIDEDMASFLVAEGFTRLEDLAYTPKEDLLEIDNIDEEIAEELQKRANAAILRIALDRAEAPQPSEDLLNLEGMTKEMAYHLAANAIVTLDDLADLSVDELSALDIEEAVASDLIMKARAHWFED